MINYSNDHEYLALVRAICATTFDDLPRLVYADWLQERGESERSEFIRVQVELAKCRPDCGPGRICRYIGESTCVDLRKSEHELLNAHGHTFINDLPGWKSFHSRNPDIYGWFHRNGDAQVKIKANLRRGFVEKIECALLEFMGGECLRCEGYKWVLGRRVPGDDPRYSMPCPDCKGTGRTPGLVDTIFLVQPIESVTISDIPQQFMAWRTWGQGMGLPDKYYREWMLALAMAEADAVSSGVFDAKELEKAVSRACVAIGRKRAGLPPLAQA